MNRFLLLILLVSGVYAKDIVLKPLVVTSIPILSDELTSNEFVEIYTQEDIQKAKVSTLYEFLNQQTSIITMPSFGNRFAQKLDMRGFGIGDGYQNIVVVVDGRRLNNIDMVAPLLASISPASIERIEIIKSSGVVANGDGANAGVINITTKRGDGYEFLALGGTYGTVLSSLYIGESSGNFWASLNAEFQRSSGERKDENNLKTATLNFIYTPTKDLELKAGIIGYKTDILYGSSLTKAQYEDDPKQSSSFTDQKYDSTALNIGAIYHVDDSLSLNIDLNKEDKKSNNLTWNLLSKYDYKSIKTAFNYSNDIASVVVGYDGFYGDRKSSANTTSKNSNAGFIVSKFYLEKSSIKVGYRYEKIDYEYDSNTSNLTKDTTLHGIEFGYNYLIDQKRSIFANYSYSYQAPDIDRFFNWGGTFNTFIDPMKANSFTLGFNYIVPNNKFKISAYYIDLNDEIYLDPIGYKNTNIDKSHKYGLDIYNKYIISQKLNIALNYNFVQAIIDKEVESGVDYTDKKLPGVSDHNIKVALNYLPTDNIALTLTSSYRSEAYAANDFGNSFAQKQDAYMKTDILVNYQKGNYKVFAKINNLFNQKNGLWIKDDVIYPVDFTTTATFGFKLRY